MGDIIYLTRRYLDPHVWRDIYLCRKGNAAPKLGQLTSYKAITMDVPFSQAVVGDL